MSEAVEGPCDCTGPHFHTVVHQCCADVADLRARLAAVLALCDQQPKETPCSCDPAYTKRGLIAPDCAWHQDIESLVADVRAAAAGDRGGLGFSGLCPTCRGIGRHLDHCPSGVSTDPASVRPPHSGEGDQ